MTDQVNDDHAFAPKYLVCNTIVAFTQLVESAQPSFQRLRVDSLKIFRQPAQPSHYSRCHSFVEPFQCATRWFQESNCVHWLNQYSTASQPLRVLHPVRH